LGDIPAKNAGLYPARISHKFRTADGIGAKTWEDFQSVIKYLATGFFVFGVKKGAHVSFFTDNRYEWAMTDFALMALSSVSVPRGSDTSPKEQKLIYTHSDSEFLVMENLRYLNDLLAEFTPGEAEAIKKIFIMDRSDDMAPDSVKNKIAYFDDVLSAGKNYLPANPGFYEGLTSGIDPDETMTIIYTSGTSGNPKGVMLSHNNFLHNVRVISPLLQIDSDAAECAVSILPSWHVYERCFEYLSATGAVCTVYSSIKTLQDDLNAFKPTLVASVPRIWEVFYAKMRSKIDAQSKFKRFIFRLFLAVSEIRLNAFNYVRGHVLSFKKRNGLQVIAGRFIRHAALFFLHPLYLVSMEVFKPLRDLMGGNLRASFSAGGSLPVYIDRFFNAVGIKLVNAYGLTETSPGIITRRLDRNTLGAIGIPLEETKVKILKENGWPASPGEKGIIYVKGAQVMKGYYKNPEATAAVLGDDGWLNTGDIAVPSFNGDIIMTGRAKSTIVLLGGENTEPEPIEEKLMESVFIDHAVVFGQDKKGLTALIAVNEKKLKHLAQRMKISWNDLAAKGTGIIKNNKVLEELGKEIKRLINRRTGFKPFENIAKFVATVKKFTIGDELTQSLKVKRQNVEKKYKDQLK
jgi:long-chain acyl-CoA synthetase